MYEAILQESNMDMTDLTKTNLRGAMYNNHTKFPEGFDPAGAEMVLMEE